MEKQNEIAVLMVQLGTPDSPKKSDVRKYLSEFLNDKRVIDISTIGRFFLVNGIIVPFRAGSSSKLYKELWEMGNGVSPLVTNTVLQQEKLAEKLKGKADVYMAMRYQFPSIPDVLNGMKKKNYKRIIVLPMFPQYASATTGSAVEKVMEVIQKWWVIPQVEVIAQYWNNEGYLNSLTENAKAMHPENYDHILFSFHGLPERQVDKVHTDGSCKNHPCETEINDENKYCYKATCFATARALAEKLGLPKEKYTVCFQSRLGKGWIEPFSDTVITDLVKNGKKKLLCFSPAFVGDCLETLIEIGVEYQEIIDENGGGSIELVPSCNGSDLFIQGLIDELQPHLRD